MNSGLNLILFTIALCVFTIVWVWYFTGRVEQASRRLIDSNRELRHYMKGLILGKGHDFGSDE